MKSERIKEITEKATEHLVAALNAGRSEALTSYLKAIGRFHHYSLHNVMLIASQKPKATAAGFRTWNQLGRFVKKGEKGIVILAPIVRQKAENEEDQQEDSTSVAGFRAAYVFDVSQTDGQELPHIGIVQGQPREYHERICAFAEAQGISVEYSSEIAPARGTSSGGRITLLPGQSEAEEFSTLAHELAHELLHRGDRRGAISRRIRETGSAATDYIQLWNGDAQLLTESFGHVRQAASQMLTTLTDG
jgi:antirestriction protein ArdC